MVLGWIGWYWIAWWLVRDTDWWLVRRHLYIQRSSMLNSLGPVADIPVIIGASLSEPHIDRDNVPRRGGMFVYMYVCMWPRVSVCRLNVPENTPIQSITCSARAHQTATPLLHRRLCGLDHRSYDLTLLLLPRNSSRSLGKSWHKDFNWPLAALTESVYKRL